MAKSKKKQQLAISHTQSQNNAMIVHNINKLEFIEDNLELFFETKKMIVEKIEEYGIELTKQEQDDVLKMIMGSYSMMNSMGMYASMIGNIMSMFVKRTR